MFFCQVVPDLNNCHWNIIFFFWNWEKLPKHEEGTKAALASNKCYICWASYVHCMSCPELHWLWSSDLERLFWHCGIGLGEKLNICVGLIWEKEGWYLCFQNLKSLKVNLDLTLIGFDLLNSEQPNWQLAQIQLLPTAFDICLKLY